MQAARMWARSEIRRGWPSLLVVALLVAITGGAIMASVAGARRAGASVDRFLASSALPQITAYSQFPLDDELRADLTADERVERVLDSQVVLATPVSVLPGLGGATLVVDDAFWGDLVHPRLVAGSYPTGPNEIAVTESARRPGLDVGDTIAMHYFDLATAEACLGGGDCTPADGGDVTITAVLRMPADLAPGPFDESLFIAPDAFSGLRGGDDAAFGHIVDLFTVPGADLGAIITDYSTRIEGGDLTNGSNDDVASAQRAAGLQRDALLVGTVIAAAAGVLITGQAFGRFLARRSSDSPTLSAIGMDAGQRTIAGWIPGLSAAVIGTVIAVPVAVGLSPVFPLQMARRADPDVGFHADWTVIAAGAAGVFVVATTAALISAALWSRPPRATGVTRSVSSATKIANQLRLTPAPTMGSRFALEPGHGVRRTPVVASLIGASAAIVVVVGAIVVTSSLDGLLRSPERYGAPWDLQVSVGESFAEAAAVLAADDRVDGVATAVTGELDVAVGGGSPTQGPAVGVESVKGSVGPVVLAGRAPNGSNEMMVGSTTMERLGLELGDEVGVSGPGGSDEMVVVGRTIVPVIGNDISDEGIIVPLDTFLALGGTDTLADVDVQAVVLATAVDPTDVGAIGDDIEAAGASLDGPFRQSSVTVLDEIRGIPLYVAMFTAFIGVLAAFHTLFVTSRRRRNDLAIMRALGYRPRQAGGIIHWQGFFVAITALVIGVPIGLIGGRLLWQAIAERTSVLSVVATPWISIAIVAAVAVAGATFVLAAGPAWTARRRHPANDLRAE